MNKNQSAIDAHSHIRPNGNIKTAIDITTTIRLSCLTNQTALYLYLRMYHNVTKSLLPKILFVSIP